MVKGKALVFVLGKRGDHLDFWPFFLDNVVHVMLRSDDSDAPP